MQRLPSPALQRQALVAQHRQQKGQIGACTQLRFDGGQVDIGQHDGVCPCLVSPLLVKEHHAVIAQARHLVRRVILLQAGPNARRALCQQLLQQPGVYHQLSLQRLGLVPGAAQRIPFAVRSLRAV